MPEYLVNLQGFLQGVLGFLAVLVPLVIVHEFGHFFFARIFGVTAEVFSIFFGPTVWSKFWKGTEWRISAIPLGGYVKLLGEEPGTELPDDQKAHALQYQPPWKRFLIFFGGPLFNFVFALFLFMTIFAIGRPRIAPVVGSVPYQSEAWNAGFRAGDEIESIEGKKPAFWGRDVQFVLRDHPDAELSFEVKRKNTAQREKLTVQTRSEMSYSRFGERTLIGILNGLSPIYAEPMVGVSNVHSPAGKAGVQTGDKIKTVNGEAIASWDDFLEKYQNLSLGDAAEIVVQSGDSKEISLNLKKNLNGDLPGDDWGFYLPELVVQPVEDTPAAEAGILKGDRVVQVDGKTVYSFMTLKDRIQESSQGNGEVAITVERNGKLLTKTMKTKESNERDLIGKKRAVFIIGIRPVVQPSGFPALRTEEIIWNPVTLVVKSSGQVVDVVWNSMMTIGLMLVGRVSTDVMSGPVGIGAMAGERLTGGLVHFLEFMALISVGLGFLNILPIPVLDGGHLLLLTIEWIRGKPLSIRQMEIVQQVGLSIILLLMVVVFKNDISKLPIFD